MITTNKQPKEPVIIATQLIIPLIVSILLESGILLKKQLAKKRASELEPAVSVQRQRKKLFPRVKLMPLLPI